MSSAAPILLTPGPLTTSARTRQAMLVDWGSWDERFNQLTASVCSQLLAILNGAATHHCVPLQGSGTFAVEAAIGTLVPRNGKVLVLINGAYGKRLAKICEVLGRDFSTFETAEDEPCSAADVDRLLHADPVITHVALVHCETSTGLLNPLPQIAQVVKEHGKRLIVDAMSSFGALPIDAREVPFDALHRRLGQVPGRRAGHGLVFAENTRWRRPRPTATPWRWTCSSSTSTWPGPASGASPRRPDVVAALHEALLQYHEDGGLPARQRRYVNNCQVLLDGMAELGLRSFLPAAIQAPIIVTFHAPTDPRYQFKAFYERVKAKGFILYPGKLTEVDTFRVGCIGHVDAAEMRAAVAAIAQALHAMQVLDI